MTTHRCSEASKRWFMMCYWELDRCITFAILRWRDIQSGQDRNSFLLCQHVDWGADFKTKRNLKRRQKGTHWLRVEERTCRYEVHAPLCLARIFFILCFFYHLWIIYYRKACHVSSWWMRYDMIKGTLLLLQSAWEFSYKNSKSIAYLLNDVEIPTKAIWLVSLKAFYIGCLLCVEFCQVLLTLVKGFIMFPRLRSRTRLIYMLLLH